MIVYIYTFPNGKKYVGQTSKTLEARAKRGEGYINSPAVYNAIKKYGWNSLIIETFPCSSKEEMDELEKYYICLYKTNNNKFGYNLTLGGDGTPKYDRQRICELWEQGFSIGEIAKKIGCIGDTVSIVLKAENLYDEKEINERKNKIIATTSGEKLKKYYLEKQHKEERKKNGLKGAKVRSKPVIVFSDKECTKLVGVYPSGRQCAKALNIDHSSPSYALTHNNYSSGYYFYFYNSDKPVSECTYDQLEK